MDFRQLQYVTTVARCQNITKAAKELFISQSALSHYIQNVEKEMGMQLFDRSTTPLSLTYAGSRFIAYAQEMLLQNKELKKEFSDITHNVKGKIKLGIPPERAAYMLPRMIPEFSAKYPSIELDIATGSGIRLVERLKNGSIDLILLSMVEKEWLQYLQCHELYKEELVVCSKKGSLPAKYLSKNNTSGLNLKVLNTMPLYVESRNHILRIYCERFFKKNNVLPTAKIELPSNIACYRMASTGLGLAVVPYLTTRLSQSEQKTELHSLGPKPVFWVLNALYRKQSYLSQPEKFLLSLIAEKFDHEFL
jgi:DNA-binding transcriptional LysR family regulator